VPAAQKARSAERIGALHFLVRFDDHRAFPTNRLRAVPSKFI
jgi:hypothetical protein